MVGHHRRRRWNHSQLSRLVVRNCHLSDGVRLQLLVTAWHSSCRLLPLVISDSLMVLAAGSCGTSHGGRAAGRLACVALPLPAW